MAQSELKSYAEILADVKKSNPSLKQADAQIAASQIFKEAKKEWDKANISSGTPVIPKLKVTQSQTDSGLAAAIDNAIREVGIDQHNIILVARRFSPDFSIVWDGKAPDGVNTLCHLEGPCRVPESGNYTVYI